MSLSLWLIPLLPLAGAAINGLFGKRFSNKTVSTVALGSTAASFRGRLVAAARLLWCLGRAERLRNPTASGCAPGNFPSTTASCSIIFRWS
jgi:hypothetical protein